MMVGGGGGKWRKWSQWGPDPGPDMYQTTTELFIASHEARLY